MPEAAGLAPGPYLPNCSLPPVRWITRRFQCCGRDVEGGQRAPHLNCRRCCHRIPSPTAFLNTCDGTLLSRSHFDLARQHCVANLRQKDVGPPLVCPHSQPARRNRLEATSNPPPTSRDPPDRDEPWPKSPMTQEPPQGQPRQLLHRLQPSALGEPNLPPPQHGIPARRR